MNYETGTYDPSLKYAMGVRKGLRLDDAGMDYRIITYQGRDVAMFKNGMMAPFYRDPTPEQKADDWNVAGMAIPDTRGEHFPAPAEAPCRWRNGSVAPPIPPIPVRLPPPELKAARERKAPPKLKLGKYKHEDVRGIAPLNAAYCVLDNGRPMLDFKKSEVGEGLREYIWLYHKLRELGRGRIAATWIAGEFYFM